MKRKQIATRNSSLCLADQHHSNVAAPSQSPHVRGGNASCHCASTVRSARVSWRGGEATTARVYGARSSSIPSLASHYIDPTNWVLTFLKSIFSLRMIASWVCHQQHMPLYLKQSQPDDTFYFAQVSISFVVAFCLRF